jgi:hypothetical protein
MLAIYKPGSASQHPASADVRINRTYNGLTVNDGTYPVSFSSVSTRYDQVTNPHAQRDGMEAYPTKKMQAVIREDGLVVPSAKNLAALWDAIENLNAAFDPINAQIADSSTEDKGFLPYKWDQPTADTSNYATGLIALQTYAKALQLPVLRATKFEGYTCRFTLLLQVVDPSRYLQTGSSVTGTGGTLVNLLAKYPSYPVYTVITSAAGDANHTIANSTTGESLVIDISGAAGTYIVDFARHKITKAGVDRSDLYISGTYWQVRKGVSDTYAITNTTNNTSRSLAWSRAFPL